MAGIKFYTVKDGKEQIEYITFQLLHPEVRHHLYDDSIGENELNFLLKLEGTKVYAIMEKGDPRPIGVVYFTGLHLAYRDCVLHAAIFDKKKRGKGKVKEIIERVKKDVTARFRPHSCTSYVIGNNSISPKMLEKLGFKKVGTREKFLMVDGRYKDLHEYYYLLSED